MENVRNHRDIKLVMTNKRRNMLVSEPNYHTTKHFFKKLLAFEMKKKRRGVEAGISRSIDFRHLQYNHVQLLI